MSHLSQESDLESLRRSLAQQNLELFSILSKRRELTQKIQGLKKSGELHSHYDPVHEKKLFLSLSEKLQDLSLLELLAFSLIMEDHALAMISGAYPKWSSRRHLFNRSGELYEMINPLLLKIFHPDLFELLNLSQEFLFLKEL